MIDLYFLFKRNKYSTRKIFIESFRHRNVADSIKRQLSIYGYSDAEFFVEKKRKRDEEKGDNKKNKKGT